MPLPRLAGAGAGAGAVIHLHPWHPTLQANNFRHVQWIASQELFEALEQHDSQTKHLGSVAAAISLPFTHHTDPIPSHSKPHPVPIHMHSLSASGTLHALPKFGEKW